MASEPAVISLVAFPGSDSVVTETGRCLGPAWGWNRDSSCFQVNTCRLTTYPGLVLDATQEPFQPPQCYHLLPCLFASRHCSCRRRPLRFAEVNVQNGFFLMAGFQVTINGRYWVTAEDASNIFPET